MYISLMFDTVTAGHKNLVISIIHKPVGESHPFPDVTNFRTVQKLFSKLQLPHIISVVCVT